MFNRTQDKRWGLWSSGTTHRPSIDSIFDAATNGNPSHARVGATAGLGAVSGFVGRCFASARVTGPPAITPELLGHIGGSLIRQGEAVLWIRVRAGRLELATHR